MLLCSPLLISKKSSFQLFPMLWKCIMRKKKNPQHHRYQIHHHLHPHRLFSRRRSASGVPGRRKPDSNSFQVRILKKKWIGSSCFQPVSQSPCIALSPCTILMLSFCNQRHIVAETNKKCLLKVYWIILFISMVVVIKLTLGGKKVG